MSVLEVFNHLIQEKYIQCGIIAFEIILIIVIFIVRIYTHRKKIKKVLEQYKNGEYLDIIPRVTQLKNGYSRFPTKANRFLCNQLSLILASSALRIGNNNMFREHIKDVLDPELEYAAVMWITVFDLNNNDIMSAKAHYHQFLQTKENERKIVAKNFLDAFFAYKEGNHELALELIEILRVKAENPVMNDYIEDMISSIKNSI